MFTGFWFRVMGSIASSQIYMLKSQSPEPQNVTVFANKGFFFLQFFSFTKPSTLKKILFYFGTQLINNVVLVSGIQKSDLAIHIHVSFFFQILFLLKLLQNIEQSSLCYIIGHYWFSILHIAVCTCQSQTPNLPLPHPSPPW